MMKKFFAAMLLAVGIILGSQVADVSKASAADVYACTEGGVEYYVYNYEGFSQDNYKTILYYRIFVKGVSGGKVTKQLVYRYTKPSGAWEYEIFAYGTNNVLSRGSVSSNSTARAILDLVVSGKFKAEWDKAQKSTATNDNELSKEEARAEELLEEAYQYFQKNQYAKVIELQKQAIAVAPKYVASYVELALMYARIKKPQQGIDLITNAIVKRGLNHYRLFFTRGQIYELMGNLSEAGKNYGQALNICNNDAARREIQQAQQKLWQKMF